MKMFLFVTSILFATLPLAFTTQAQTGPTGTWRVESPTPGTTWTVALRADGPRLTGAVRTCLSLGGTQEIYEGKIDGNTISFKCKSGDRDRTLTLTGTVNGDEITFSWELQVRDGGNPPGGQQLLLFGPAAPLRFTAGEPGH